jgi:predicted MarR family transcription regulator
LAQKAGDSSVTSKKRRKQTEIGLRKLEKRIADIAQTLNFEDRPAVQDIVKHIDKVRSDILMSMFDMPKKELGPEKKEKP